MTVPRRIRQLILIFAIIGLSLAALHVTSAPRSASAACTAPLPASKGVAMFSVTVPATGTYRLWTHMYSPASGNDAVILRVNETHCEIRVGDSNIAAQAFTWVDYRDGKSAAKNDFELAAGTHTFTFAGLDSKVGIDKVLLTLDTACVPVGVGDNCAVAAASTSNSGGQMGTTAPKETNIVRSANKKSFGMRLGLGALGVVLLLVSACCILWFKKPQVLRTAMQKLPLPFLSKNQHVQPVSTPLVMNEAPVVGIMHTPHKFHKLWGLLGAVVFGIAGAFLSVMAFAATHSVGFLMQGAKVSGNAAIVSHQSAIGGKMVQFDVPPSSTTSPASSTPSATPPGSKSPTPPPTSPPASSQSCPTYPAFPDANCTGVPAGVTLTAYMGPCTITTPGTVIDAKTVNCHPLYIHTTSVTIKNSRVNGSVTTSGEGNNYSFTMTDSEVITPMATAWTDNFTSIGSHNFTLIRVEASGGNRSVNCARNCTVQDSWVHGQKIVDSPRIHASGIRMGQGSKIIHNRILCEPPQTSTDGGCSADLTGYGDFEAVRDNRIEKNLFMASPASGVCAYGGSSGDDGSKPYGNQAANIVFIDNVFQRGSNGNCGIWLPILDFNSSRPGNQWINNKWDDGAMVPPDR